MAGGAEGMETSLGFNRRLRSRLSDSDGSKVVHRIGWTNDGQEVPKDGEMGLCPMLGEGVRIRALGRFGSWTGSFLRGGGFTVTGSTGSCFAAGMTSGIAISDGGAGRAAGLRMAGGRLELKQAAGDDLGQGMTGGLILLDGIAGARVGAGMSGGLIVVRGSVGPDAGAGMTGGRIIIDGRFSSHSPDAVLTTLGTKDLNDINEMIGDVSAHVPPDAAVLIPNTDAPSTVETGSEGGPGWSSLRVASPDGSIRLPSAGHIDTMRLIGDRPPHPSIGLHLPLIPIGPTVPSNRVGESHPQIVPDDPRSCDLIEFTPGSTLPKDEDLSTCGGVIVRLHDLPSLDRTDLDGLFVVLRTIMEDRTHILISDRATYADRLIDLASWFEIDGILLTDPCETGEPYDTILPRLGRLLARRRDELEVPVGLHLPWDPSVTDLVISASIGLGFVVASLDDALSMNARREALRRMLRTLGLASIDDVQRRHVRAITLDAAGRTGLRMSGFDRPHPMWFSK